jgi:undecaprenyl-diphosphatase
MDVTALLLAALMGVVEGVTEFIPVSSTGHLIFVGHVLGVGTPTGTFEVVIQLGAILAIVWLYRARLFGAVAAAGSSPAARRFILNVLLAFLPAAVIGALLARFITSVLFSPWVVAVSLIVGGFAIFAIERWKPRPLIREVDDFGPLLALAIGVCQVVSMIPGVSRAGATIMGAMLLGVDRKPATEFSFFLAIPTMIGASAYELYENQAALSNADMLQIAVGFVVAFISAVVVVRVFVSFVQRSDFRPFAWYRIAAGLAMIAALLIF